jgi:phenylpropionate dioxygenase-like ring-hydroxylating dioxygenase large terminal subunit
MTEPIDAPERDDGWRPLIASDAVDSATIVAVTHGDEDLVVWRDLRGQPCVMAARCPHQWSHLGAEGVLDGDEIVCTAHFWRFDRQGRGTKLTVKGRRDPKADIDVWPCSEHDGTIWVAPTRDG